MVVYLTHAREIKLVTHIRTFEDLVFSVISFSLSRSGIFVCGEGQTDHGTVDVVVGFYLRFFSKMEKTLLNIFLDNIDAANFFAIFDLPNGLKKSNLT